MHHVVAFAGWKFLFFSLSYTKVLRSYFPLCVFSICPDRNTADIKDKFQSTTQNNNKESQGCHYFESSNAALLFLIYNQQYDCIVVSKTTTLICQNLEHTKTWTMNELRRDPETTLSICELEKSSNLTLFQQNREKVFWQVFQCTMPASTVTLCSVSFFTILFL